MALYYIVHKRHGLVIAEDEEYLSTQCSTVSDCLSRGEVKLERMSIRCTGPHANNPVDSMRVQRALGAIAQLTPTEEKLWADHRAREAHRKANPDAVCNLPLPM